MSRHKNTKKFPHLKQSEKAANFFAKSIPYYIQDKCLHAYV